MLESQSKAQKTWTRG